MLIKQNQLLGEATAFLNTLDRLLVNENTFPAQMVNVRHNSRLGKDLVQLESFLQFGQTNGVNDGGYALHLVCEANDLPSHNHLAFVVNEESLFSDISILETYCQLKNSNFNVYISPISNYSPYYTKLQEALALDEAYPTYEESPNLQRYLTESIVDDAKSKISSGVSSAQNTIKSSTKDAASKLASVRKEISAKMSKAATATGSAKVHIMRQVDKLKGLASDLKSQIVGAKNSIAHKASGVADSVRSAVRSARKRVTDGVSDIGDSLGKHIDSAKSAISNAASSVKSKFTD